MAQGLTLTMSAVHFCRAGKLLLCAGSALLLLPVACSAQNGAIGGQRIVTSESSQVARANAPAILKLDLRATDLKPSAQLELTLSPEIVRPNDSFVVVVSETANGNQPGNKLGTFAFYPPAIKGELRSFLVDLPKAATMSSARVATEIKVELISVDPSVKSESAVKVVSARVLDQ